jgi:hypothetical protein
MGPVGKELGELRGVGEKHVPEQMIDVDDGHLALGRVGPRDGQGQVGRPVHVGLAHLLPAEQDEDDMHVRPDRQQVTQQAFGRSLPDLDRPEARELHVVDAVFDDHDVEIREVLALLGEHQAVDGGIAPGRKIDDPSDRTPAVREAGDQRVRVSVLHDRVGAP